MPNQSSYDLIVRLNNYNNDVGEAWGWSGEPMKSLEPIEKRLKRERKRYGVRFTGYQIVRSQLDMKTGETRFEVLRMETWAKGDPAHTEV